MKKSLELKPTKNIPLLIWASKKSALAQITTKHLRTHNTLKVKPEQKSEASWRLEKDVDVFLVFS